MGERDSHRSVDVWPARPPTLNEELLILIELAGAMLARGIRELDHVGPNDFHVPAHEVRLALTDLEGAAVKLIRIRQMVEATR